MNLPENAPEYLWALAIVAPALSAYMTARLSRSVQQVRHQVENTHDTNLRDDLDLMHRDIRGISEDVREIRKDIQDIRREQNGFERSVKDFVRRVHPDEPLIL